MSAFHSEYPLVAAIIPNWNGREFILACLRSLAELTYPKEQLQIIVVDNGSTDGSQEAIRMQFNEMSTAGFRNCRLVENSSNQGAPAAYNQAIQYADPRCEYIWKLDNDVTLDSGALTVLLRVYQSAVGEHIGGVGGKIRNARSGLEDSIGARLTPRPRRWTKIVDYVHVGNGYNRSEYTEEVDMVSGSCCLFPRRVFRECGLFDERFFLYYDDTEFCLRLRKSGWKFFVAKTAQINHHAYSSTASISACRLYYWLRNHLLLGKCYFTGPEKALFYLIHIFNLPWKIVRIARLYAFGKYGAVTMTTFWAYRDFLLGRFRQCPEHLMKDA